MEIHPDESAQLSQFAYASVEFAVSNAMLADGELTGDAAEEMSERMERARIHMSSNKQAALRALADISHADLRRMAIEAGAPEGSVRMALELLSENEHAGLAPRLEDLLGESGAREDSVCSQCCGAVLMTIGGVLIAGKAPILGGFAITTGVIGIASTC